MEPVKLLHEEVEVGQVDLARDARLNMVGEIALNESNVTGLGFRGFASKKFKQLDAISCCLLSKFLQFVCILKDVVEAVEQAALLLTHGIRQDCIRSQNFGRWCIADKGRSLGASCMCVKLADSGLCARAW